VHEFRHRSTRYVLEHRFTKFNEITKCNSHYAVEGHSRSPILVPIQSYDFLLVIHTNYTSYLAPFPSYGWLLVKFSPARAEFLTLTLSLGWSPANIAIDHISLKIRFFGLHCRCRKYRCMFNHFYVIRSESYQIRWNYAAVRAITPFKVIQGHRVWYQSKAHMRLAISD